MNPYTVVMRSRASAIFYPGDEFSINCSMESTACKLTFRTTYEEKPTFDASLPVDLWAEARGPAKTLHEAVELFANAALEISTFIALTANAYMGTLEPEIVFDENPETDEHEFFQSLLPHHPVILVPGRRIDVEVLGALVHCLTKHPERKALSIAIAQYTEALQSWRPGREISCLAHLYMGVEALTKAVRQEHSRISGHSEAELATQWGIKDDLPKRDRRNQIESETRKRLIFRGDNDTFTNARKVSDGFEHGFSDFNEMRKPARDVIVKTAAYLRQAIFETAGVQKHILDRAIGVDYEDARGPLVTTRYVYGTLIGKAGRLAADNQQYPFMKWETTLKNVIIDAKGKYSFTPNENLTGVFGEGIQLQLQRWEIWDGSKIVDPAKANLDASPIEPVQVEITRASSKPVAQFDASQHWIRLPHSRILLPWLLAIIATGTALFFYMSRR
jgi:hypothetical protein